MEERCMHVTVHKKKKKKKQKHTQEPRVTELACNQTVCSHFQPRHRCISGTMLYFLALISCICFFSLRTVMCTHSSFSRTSGSMVHMCYASFIRLPLNGTHVWAVMHKRRSRIFIVTVTIGHGRESSNFKKLNLDTLHNGH